MKSSQANFHVNIVGLRVNINFEHNMDCIQGN